MKVEPETEPEDETGSTQDADGLVARRPLEPRSREEKVERARLWALRTWTTIGLLVLGAVFVWAFHEPLRLVIPAVIVGWIIIYLLNPIVDLLEKWHVHRLFGTLIAYAVMFGVFAAFWLLVFPLIASQISDLVDAFPAMFADVQAFVNEILENIGLSARLQIDPSELETQQAIQEFLEGNSDAVMELLREAGSLVATLLTGALALVLAPVLAFYALVDLPRLTEGVQRLFPPESRSEVLDVSRRILATVGGYVRGQLLVSVFVGVATAIGLALIGLPFWALVATLAGIFNLVPFVGPFVGGVLGGVVALVQGDGLSQAVLVVVIMIVIQQVDNHLVTPTVLSRTVRMHPITIILSLVVAAALFGILGMLIVIPFLAVAKLVLVYVLVTRFPSMQHLGGGEQIIDGVPPQQDTRLVAMGRELRDAWDRRRGASRRAGRRG